MERESRGSKKTEELVDQTHRLFRESISRRGDPSRVERGRKEQHVKRQVKKRQEILLHPEMALTWKNPGPQSPPAFCGQPNRAALMPMP